MTLDTARDESSPATPSPDAPSRPAHPASVLSRRLAAVLPVTVVLLVVGQTLTPHGLDKPITTTATALRELPIAAAHAGRVPGQPARRVRARRACRLVLRDRVACSRIRLPAAGSLSPRDLQAIAERSNTVLDSMAGRAQWLQTYVTDDKLFCLYTADDAETVAEHAKAGGFPCDDARQICTIIDATTAEAPV